ncbi:DUF4097 family beta strand repeat-containing protein [Sphingobacterium corticibacter]|nr:DUF4097 family beta strand repeat-containing protein [Sphingobacterium corticibacter]
MKTQIISSVIALLAMCITGTAQTTPAQPPQAKVVYGTGTFNTAKSNSNDLEKKEYRFKKNSGKLLVNSNAISAEGYDGNEVVVTTWAERTEQDERAAGLQGINSSGLKDNTGVGLQLTEANDGTTVLSVVNYQKLDSVHLRLPKRIALSIKSPSSWTEGTIALKDLLSEIEVSNTFGDVKLQQVTGPMTIKTVHGNIEAVLDKPVKGPVSLVSTLGFIDVAIPKSTPANLELRTTLGEIFAAEELNIDLKPTTKQKDPTIVLAKTKTYVNTDSLRNKISIDLQSEGLSDSIGNVIEQAMESANVALESAFSELPQSFTISGASSNRIQGTINGGGENINLRTTHGKIYLRTTSK